MAIRLRRGNLADFDKNKLVAGELGLILDAGELHFCYSAGNTKKLQTAEDLQAILDASGTAYSALLALIADLEANPSELTNILNNITALQVETVNARGTFLNVEARLDNNDTQLADIAQRNLKIENFYQAPETNENIYAALVRAITYLNANGGVLEFDSKTYTVTGLLPKITHSGVYFKGKGVRATIINFTDNNDTFRFGDEALTTIVGVGVEDLTIKYTGTRTDGKTFSFVNVQKYTIENLEIINAYDMFMFGSPTDINSNFAVIKDIIGDCKRNCIKMDSTNGVHFINVQINSEYVNAASVAVSFGSSASVDTLFFDNCLFQRFAYGFAYGASSGIVQNIFMTNTIFDATNVYSVITNPTGTAKLVRANFGSGCWFTSKTESAVVIDCVSTALVDGIKFSDCEIVNAYKRGIHLLSQYAVNLDVLSSRVAGSSQEGSGLYPGIEFASGTKRFTIRGSKSGQSGGSNSNQSYGIIVGANCDSYTISDNDLIGNATDGLADNGGTYTKKLIKDNLGYNPRQSLTSPTIPLNGVVLKTPFSTPVEIYISGGTVSNIQINSTLTGLTHGAFNLMPSDYIVLYYTVAPAWTWVGK